MNCFEDKYISNLYNKNSYFVINKTGPQHLGLNAIHCGLNGWLLACFSPSWNLSFLAGLFFMLNESISQKTCVKLSPSIPFSKAPSLKYFKEREFNFLTWWLYSCWCSEVSYLGRFSTDWMCLSSTSRPSLLGLVGRTTSGPLSLCRPAWRQKPRVGQRHFAWRRRWRLTWMKWKSSWTMPTRTTVNLWRPWKGYNNNSR